MRNFTSKHNVDVAGTSVAPAAAKLPPVKYEDFSGGYFKGAKGTEVPKNAAQDANDFEITRDNKLRRAPGTTLIEDFPARIPTQLILHPDLNSTAELLAVYGPELGIKREGAMAWFNLNLPLNHRYHHCLYGGDLIFSNSRDTVFVRHPRENVITALRELPMGVTMAVIAGRLFIGGAAISGNFESMGQFWTGFENYDDVDAEHGSGFELMIADTGSGDHIVANRVLGFDMMVILCRRSVWLGRVTGDPDRPLDFQLRFAGKGCVSEPTACVVHGGVMYLGDEGVEVFDGNDSTNVSAAINTEILPLDEANLSKYTASYDHRRGWYYLHTPTNTYIFDLRFKRWYKRSQKVVSSTLFSTQYAQEAWAAAVGSWAAQTLTWADKDVPEANIPDTVFLGDNITPVRRIEKEDYDSEVYFGIAQNAFWVSQIDEAQLQSNKLWSVKAVRATYEADDAEDTTVEFKLNNGVSLGVCHLVGTGAVDVTQMKTNRTERAIMAGIYFLTGSPIISSYESDVFPRSEKRKLDGRAAPVIEIPSDPTARRIVLLSRTLRTNGNTANLVGRAEHETSNAGGAATLGSGWIDNVKRYGQFIRVPNGGVINAAYVKTTAGLSVNALLDPDTPVRPVIVRVRDVVQVTRTAGVGWGSCGFTMGGSYIGQDGAAEALRSVGFHSYGGSTWQTYKTKNATNTVQHLFDTGIDIQGIHELMWEMDGSLKQVRYYIDGVLVDTYDVEVDVTVAALNRADSIYHTCRPALNTTLQFNIAIGIGPLIEVEVLN